MTNRAPLTARARGAAACLARAPGNAAPTRLALVFAVFAVFAAGVAAFGGQPLQRSWGLWASGGYAAAGLAAAACRPRGRDLAVLLALAGSLLAPLAWQATLGRSMPTFGEGALTVVARSGALLIRHGSPYLPAADLLHTLDYDPYEPVMAAFGLPRAIGVSGALGNPRLWLGVTGALVLWLAFRLAGRRGALRHTAFAFASPVLALPLALGGTDVPVVGLLCLTLALAGRQRPGWAGVSAGVASAIKATAWPAVPVIIVMTAVRGGAPAALRCAVLSVLSAAAGVIAAAPTALAQPRELLDNVVLFPLGMTHHETTAASPLPGHLLTQMGARGQWAAIALMAAAGVAIGAWLVIRPPADLRSATWRLALGYVLLFILAPASRWGYFSYPAGLLGWLALTTGHTPAGEAVPGRGCATRRPPSQPGAHRLRHRGRP